MKNKLSVCCGLVCNILPKTQLHDRCEGNVYFLILATHFSNLFRCKLQVEEQKALP